MLPVASCALMDKIRSCGVGLCRFSFVLYCLYTIYLYVLISVFLCALCHTFDLMYENVPAFLRDTLLLLTNIV